VKLLILSTPRTGSNALCECLSFAKSLGQVEAFFAGWGEELNNVFDERNVTLQANMGVNGNYATKVMWDYLDHIAQHVKRSGVVAEWLASFDRVIHLHREDTIAEAVSWYMALGNGQWHSKDPVQRPDPEYNYRQIAHLHGIIEGYNYRTRDYIRLLKPKAMTVSYEWIVMHGWKQATTDIFDWIGVKPEGVREPELERQSHPLKAQYIERFKSEWQASS
jgi:LPS sulfotransferase NodH